LRSSALAETNIYEGDKSKYPAWLEILQKQIRGQLGWALVTDPPKRPPYPPGTPPNTILKLQRAVTIWDWMRDPANIELGHLAVDSEEILLTIGVAAVPAVAAAGGVAAAVVIHRDRDENGKSLHAVNMGEKAAIVIHSQKWIDPSHPELGVQNCGNLVQMQKRRGYPHGKENRVKVKKEEK
jgi:hypothetical protein